MSEQYGFVVDNICSRKIPTITLKLANCVSSAPHVIVLHGLFSRKEAHLEELYLLARHGFVAMAIDMALHGTRLGAYDLPSLLKSDYLGTIARVIYDTVDDLKAIVTETSSSISRFGIYGISAGGLVAHALAITDSRVDVIAAIASSPDWKTADARLVSKPKPEFDVEMQQRSPVNNPEKYLPKALLMVNGQVDDVISPAGSELLFNRLKPLYYSQGIDHRLSYKSFPDVGHSYTPEMRRLALNWMIEHLSEQSPVD